MILGLVIFALLAGVVYLVLKRKQDKTPTGIPKNPPVRDTDKDPKPGQPTP